MCVKCCLNVNDGLLISPVNKSMVEKEDGVIC